jgi:hypothetical protein
MRGGGRGFGEQASSQSFGFLANQQQQQQQQQQQAGGGFRQTPPQQGNRFAALQRGRGACFTCGSPDHQQRDCPRNRPGAQPAQPQAPAKKSALQDVTDLRTVAPSVLRAEIGSDLKDEWPTWPFTCYSPNRYGVCLLSGDVSPEELRCSSYACSQRSERTALSSQVATAAASRNATKLSLVQVGDTQLMSLVNEAAQGRPWAGPPVLPPLTGPVLFQSTPPPPPPPVQMPNVAPYVRPQPVAPSPSWMTPPPQPVQAAPVPVGVPPAPTGVTSAEQAWAAPFFTLGSIPETPPPSQFVQ